MERLQSQPYRLFFPLGLVLALIGVGQWLLLSQRVIEQYLSIFHSMAQVQGFLICFAMGFLFTMLPRRTESEPPGILTLSICAVCPVATTLAAWLEAWAVAQVFWLTLLVTLVAFALRRFRRGERRPPIAFLWIPLAVLFGTVGSVLTGFGAAIPSLWALHEIGRGLVLQGFFLCLVLGVGSFVVPLFTRGYGLPDDTRDRSGRQEKIVHLGAAFVLAASFVVETLVSTRWGFALRASVLWTVLLVLGEIHRRPTKPGWIRRLVLVGAWCVPLGYTLGFLFPILGKGALHVTFIGGFGLMVLSVSSQVILGHGGYEALRDGRPKPLLAVFLCLAASVAARLMMEVRDQELYRFMTLSAGFFVAALLIWAGFLMPRLLRSPRPDET